MRVALNVHMKKLIQTPLFLVLCLPQLLWAQRSDDALRSQLQSPEGLAALEGEASVSHVKYSMSLKVSEKHCEELAQKRAQITSRPGTQEFTRDLAQLRPLESQCYQSVKVSASKNEVEGFMIEKEDENSSATRTYDFDFTYRARQNARLRITDNANLTGNLSSDLLETTIVFIPRKVVPHMEINNDDQDCQYRKVILPTEEFAIFDAITKELVGGVLSSEPIDLTQSRHRRKFAGIEYLGNGIMIRADRRAGSPELNYRSSFNVNEKIREAIVTHKGKECLVPKELIWEGANEPNSYPYFKYETDQEFLDVVINPVCGWDLTMSDII